MTAEGPIPRRVGETVPANAGQIEGQPHGRFLEFLCGPREAATVAMYTSELARTISLRDAAQIGTSILPVA